jgi:hypothetical protein
MIKTIINALLAYLIWILFLVLGVWFIIISRDGFLGAMSTFYVKTNLARSLQMRFIDRILVLALGLCWMTCMIVVEQYLRNGIKSNDLTVRIARVMGPEMLLIFAADLFLMWLQGASGSSWLRWFILAAELAVGILLVIYAKAPHLFRPQKTKPDESN